MKRVLFSALSLALFTGNALASAGFSCEADDKNVAKLVVAGATPRSGGALINFGGVLEIEGKKAEFKQPDVKGFTWNAKGLQVRVTARAGDQSFDIRVNAKRDPKDEDVWAGTYEVTQGAADKKTKAANVKRGKVKCFVE